MIRRNIDVSIGLVNGTIGTVVSISKDKANEISDVRIQLQTGKIYSIPRLEYKFIVMDKIFIIRKQFPICSSYGITIHKSQGLSLTNVVVEAGNSVFSCGQTYVALSRVTKLEGLHLINFDPSCIMADESAILEYNRLRQIYRNDLLPLPIPQNKQTANIHVKHTRWMISKNVLKIQNDQLDYESENWIICGLPNEDGVSCYANSAIQSLLHSSTIRRILVHCNESDTLKTIFNQYTLKTSVDVKALRHFADIRYTLSEQQDPAEFIMHLCNASKLLRNIIKHKLITVIRCPDCDKRHSETTSNYILSLCLPVNTKTCKLQDLIDYNVGHWQEIEANCSNKCNRKILQKIDINLQNTILILQLKIFTLSKICNFRINEIPKAKVCLNNKHYKIVNAIFHQGQSIHAGHYTTLIRQKNQWIQINDMYIKKIPWPRGAKDAYILVLEEITK